MVRTAAQAAKWVPSAFTESSEIGGLFTIVSHLVMVVVFFCELSSFMTSQTRTIIGMDVNDGQLLQINFDIEMYDIECGNLQLVAVSQTNDEPIPISSEDFWLRAIDGQGRTFGMASKPTEDDKTSSEAIIHNRKMSEVVAEDGQKELDSDWASSHDGFKHNSFDHVIQGHDFVLINFFAGWCSHCKVFAPTWAEIASEVNGDSSNAPMKFPDRDGQERQVRMLRINCVDFKKICDEKGVDAYPMMRLYKADGSFSLFEGKRNKDDVVAWLRRTVKMKSYGWASSHEAFERGCSAKGRLQMPRVPGHLELMVGGVEQNLNPSMTNVSHLVKHLSFSVPDNLPRRSFTGLSPEAAIHGNPMDGKAYVTKEFHQVWIHDVKVVTHVNKAGTPAYLFTHQHRLSRTDIDKVPQVQIHFDIEPFSMYEVSDNKRWYGFVTSIMAVLGGIYAMMRLGANASLGLEALMRVKTLNVNHIG